MALAGKGAICIWNDITPEGRDEFYAWHLHEHMPERAAIPGFQRSRRFIALDDTSKPEFFTLYETTDTTVLTGAEYLARLNAPTPWTRTATQAFRNTSRALTGVEASIGPGCGGMLATLRFAVKPGAEDRAIAIIGTRALPAAAALPQVTGAHFCRTNQTASASRTAESRDRADILTAPEWIILIEGCAAAALAAATAGILAALAEVLNGPAEAGTYRLEYQC